MPDKIKSGSFSQGQIEAIIKAARAADSSFLSDLEGAGPICGLEKAMAGWLGVKHVLAVSSGTAALHAALIALGIGPGDEIIVTPYSWGQSVAPVLFCGATAVFADIDPFTLFLDASKVEDLITDKTKAILPVHLFGHICNMDPLAELAQKYKLKIVSDAAHSLGALRRGKSAARYGDIACYSLGRGKLISGGEGGLLATDNDNLYETALTMTQHATRSRRELGPGFVNLGTMDMGYNFRIHPLAAVLGLADLDLADDRLAHRRRVHDAFRDGLADGSQQVQLPLFDAEEECAAYGIALTHNLKDISRISRLLLVEKAQKYHLPLRSGPVGQPLSLRLHQYKWPARITHHFTHQPGACPVAERKCAQEELWMLSGLDMDGNTQQQAYEMGEKLRHCLI